jgi:gliding motility-associated-like protein
MRFIKIRMIFPLIFLFLILKQAEGQVTFEKKYIQNCNSVLPFADGRFLVTGASDRDLAFVFCDPKGDTVSKNGYSHGTEYVKGMNILNSANGIYVAGEISQGNSTVNDIVVLRINTEAQVIWSKRYGIADSGQIFRKMILDAAGNILILSRFSSKDEFCITSIDPNGGMLWSKRYRSVNAISGESMAVNSLGQIVVCGYTDLGVMFNYPYKKGNLIISTLASNGNLLWSKVLNVKTAQNNPLEGCLLDVVSRDGVSFFAGLVTNDLTSEALALAVDNQGNIIAKNFFSSNSNICHYYGFSNVMFSSGNEMIYSGGGYSMGCQKTDLVKLNLALDTVWTRSYGNLGNSFMMNGSFLMTNSNDNGFFMTNGSVVKFDVNGRIHCDASTPLIPLDYIIEVADIQLEVADFASLTPIILVDHPLTLNYFEYCNDTCLTDCNPSTNFDFQCIIPDTICNNSCISILSSATQNNSVFTWQWSFDGAVPANSNAAQPQNICYSIPGAYAVQLHLTSTGGIDTLINYEIQVVNVQPSLSNSQICQNQTVELNPNVQNASYQWSTGENTPAITVAADGFYTVTVSKYNCSRVDTSVVDMLSAPYFVFNDQYLICPEDKQILNGPVGTNYQYLWSNGATTSTILVNQPGKYWLRVTNPCGSFIDTALVLSRSDCDEEFFIPDAFRPTNGSNDRFVVTAKNISNYSIGIYSRWGEQLFRSNDLANSWDGKFKGKVCEAGVYVYRIEYQNQAGEKRMKMGNVTLIR